MWRSGLFGSSVLAIGAFLASGTAFSADLPLPEIAPVPDEVLPLPAVSAPNGKVALFGGGLESNGPDGEIFGGQGSFSIPIATRFGLQGDGFASWADGELIAGGAGHLFWRDPSLGLVGVYAGGADNELFDFTSVRGGVEGEAYLGRLSIEALLGWENLDFDAGGSDDHFFALADLAFYATDDFRVWGGYRHWNDIDMAAFGAEYLLPMQWGPAAPALFAEGRVGENDYMAAWGGIRLYFGPEQKSLIRRHREDDPRLRMEDQAGFSGSSSGCRSGTHYEPPNSETEQEAGCYPDDLEIPPDSG